MATVFYPRALTAEQTIEHQVTQAKAVCFMIGQEVIDDGKSEVTTKFAERPGSKRLFNLLREGDLFVVRCVHRLGSSYEGVSENIRAFMRHGVVSQTIINEMTFDGATKNPMPQTVRKKLIDAQSPELAEVSVEAQKAGVPPDNSRSTSDKLQTPVGSTQNYTASQIEQVIALRDYGADVTQISLLLGLPLVDVHHIHASMAEAHKAVERWI
jgi:DNA invertase Pin-like site-specific DNA recombinase